MKRVLVIDIGGTNVKFLDTGPGSDPALLSYKQGSYGDYMGLCVFKRPGKPLWQKHVADVAMDILHADDVVLGVSCAKDLNKPGCRVGDNSRAFLGGIRPRKNAPTKKGV
jgi:hypothetical protein